MTGRGVRLWAALALTSASLRAQALPFHTESALTTAFEERGLRSVFAVARRGDLTVGTAQLVVLPFAPHQRVTTAVAVPVLYKRLTRPEPRYANAGLGDVTLMTKWAFLARDRFAGTARLALVGRARVPTGTTGATLDDGTPAPRALQLGSGAVAGGASLVATITRNRWGLTAALGHMRSATDDGYRIGPATQYDVALGIRIPRYVETVRTRTLQLYLEWNGLVAARDRQNGSPVPDTGGHVAFLSPGLQWVALPQLLFEGSVQVPVVQDLNGTQSDHGIRVALGSRFLFS